VAEATWRCLGGVVGQAGWAIARLRHDVVMASPPLEIFGPGPPPEIRALATPPSRHRS
jgi:hypothetical protein